MKFHKEGRVIMTVWGLFLLALFIPTCIFFFQYPVVFTVLTLILIILFVMVAQFFRVPKRNINLGDTKIISPCDGKVVVIEEVFESEILNTKCTQISIFMSPLNVHVNYAPISGEVEYYKYHAGLYLVAWHPKSSTDNERTTLVVKHKNGQKVLFRQIAGAVARRIICYKGVGDQTEMGKEFGFIKFGSRVDVLIPTSAKIKVNIGDKVKGVESLLAEF